MPALTIDLNKTSKLSQRERELIQLCLKQHANTTHFHRKTPYSVMITDPKSGQNIVKKIQFTHSLLQYACNPHGKRQGEHKYAIMQRTKFNLGGFAKLYRSKHSIYANCQDLSQLIEKKEHAVKIGHLYPEEYENASPELRAKPITQLKKKMNKKTANGKNPYYSVMVCRFFKAKDLDKLLFEDRKQPYRKRLNILERLNLCYSVTEALESQVHRRNIIHRDIKPENILVSQNQNENKYQTSIFDFGLSRERSKKDYRLVGTPAYCSPEQFYDGVTSFKSDVYSLACVFTEILGCDRKKAIKSNQEIMLEHQFQNLLAYNLGKGFPQARFLPLMATKLLIQKMVSTDTSKRPSTGQIKANLRAIKNTVLLDIENGHSLTPSI